MIPLFFLGDPSDLALSQSISTLLLQNHASLSPQKFSWNPRSQVFVIDGICPDYLDAGGGIIILKESFSAHFAPRHLLHANCIIPEGHPQALSFIKESGLPYFDCGSSFSSLSLSCAEEQTFVTLRNSLQTLNGNLVPAGDFSLNVPASLGMYPTLCYAAIELLLDRLH